MIPSTATPSFANFSRITFPSCGGLAERKKTCGASFWLTSLIGAPGKRTLLRGVGYLCAPNRRSVFAAHYLMDSSTPETRDRHLDHVERKMDKLLAPL